MVGGVLQRNEINCTDPGLQLGDPAPLTALLLARASETVEGVRITPREKGDTRRGEPESFSLLAASRQFLSPAVSRFSREVWFYARSRFVALY